MTCIAKILKPSIDCLSELLEITTAQTDIAANLATKEIKINKNGNQVSASFDTPYSEYNAMHQMAGSQMPPYSIRSNDKDYAIIDSRLSKLSDNSFNDQDNNGFYTEIELYEFHNISILKKYYYRYFIPVESTSLFSGDTFERLAYKTEGGQYGSILNIGSLNAHIYTCKTYIVVEPLDEYEYAELEKIAYSILLAFGLLTGTLHLEESYAVASTTSDFSTTVGVYYKSLRETLKSQYSIFTTNAYSVLIPIAKRSSCRDAEERMMNIIKNKWGCRIKPMPTDVISNMCALLHSSGSIARAAVTILEASRFGLEIQAAVYCIVYETICSYIQNTAKRVLDDAEWGAINIALNKVINNACVSDDKKKFLRKKIDNANQPTNQDKLSAPFKTFGYELSPEEFSLIKDRNRFLHGSTNIAKRDKETDKLFYSCIMYHKLCCILLLKLSGYSGYIINNMAIYDFGATKTADGKWGFQHI